VTKNSYGSLLRSSYLIGGAQVVFILTGLVKMKVAAVLLGPAGVGLVGLYINLMQASATVASLGMGHAGTRQIAKALGDNDPISVEHTRRALYWTTAVLALVAGLVFWGCRGLIAKYVLDNPDFAGQVGWLSVGVALSVAATGQNALLTGLRRVGDLARASIGTGVLGTVLSVLGLWVWGEKAVLLMVMVTPALAFVFWHFYAAKAQRPSPSSKDPFPPTTWQQIRSEWQVMRQLGLAFMGAGLAVLIGPLIVRTLVQRELGLEAAGQFQAAWSISLTYMGLVLGVLTSDFHPRLTAIIKDKVSATQLVNEQTDIAVLLCAPVLLLLLGLAPWVLKLLYTAEFEPAVEILRWQLLGDVLKVLSFPLGFVLLAAGRGKTFLLLEIIGMSAFVLITWLGLPIWGLKTTGIAFLLMYVVYLPLVWRLSKTLIDFNWALRIRLQLVALMVSALCIVTTSNYSPLLGAILSVALAITAASWAVMRLKGHVSKERLAN
jgi:O-antigen/teichoic acid export membrane protein